MSKISYGYLHLPDNIQIENLDGNRSKFIWAPFDRGFGHTIGNTLRRILLSSIESPAVVSIKLSPFLHEFMAVDGIHEDMTDIVMNLKEVLLKLEDFDNYVSGKIYEIDGVIEVTDEEIKNNDGSVKIKAEDIFIHELISVVNGDKVIFTVVAPQSIDVKIKFMVGRGYIPVDRLEITNLENGEVLIDGLFSPVKLVNCKVENSRVGSSTDFDKLIIDVDTDGRISPVDALSYSLQIASHLFTNVTNISRHFLEFADNLQKVENDEKLRLEEEIMRILSENINDMDLTVRSSNCLRDSGIKYFGEMLLYSESEMLKMKNLGKKSLDELKSKIDEKNHGGTYSFRFGMDLSKYGLNKENIRKSLDDFVSDEHLSIMS